ncbi:hypothetical protein ABPG77_010444 [Micractinium sp. CCAP 211/92]
MARVVHYLFGLVALQIIFAVVIPAVTSTVLYPSEGCYLNLLPGQVCQFAYVTSGFSLLFSLLLAAGGYVTLKQGVSGFLPPIYGSLGLFGSFWWMVAAITFTQRGKQASDDGLPEESARNGVIALSWLEFILFLAAGVAVIYDRILFRRYRIAKDKTRSVLDLEQQAEFKQQYVHTQALGATPVA